MTRSVLSKACSFSPMNHMWSGSRVSVSLNHRAPGALKWTDIYRDEEVACNQRGEEQKDMEKGGREIREER